MKKGRYNPTPTALQRDLELVAELFADIARRCPLGPTEILMLGQREAA